MTRLYRDDGITIRGKTLVPDHKAIRKQNEAWLNYKTTNKPHRPNMEVYDDKYGAHVLQSRCPGTLNNLVLSEEQMLLEFKDKPCTGKSAAFMQVGPIVKNVHKEAWCNCNTSLATAAIQRSVKSKGLRQLPLTGFLSFAKMWIRKKYKPNPQNRYLYRVEIIDKAIELLMESNKDAATKQRIRRQLEEIKECGVDKVTSTQAFTKKEITINTMKMPRMISAREPSLRQISAVPYKQTEEQIYDNKHFIKKLREDEVCQRLIEQANKSVAVLCLDISSFDSA